jgi:hypothetical protein
MVRKISEEWITLSAETHIRNASPNGQGFAASVSHLLAEVTRPRGVRKAR